MPMVFSILAGREVDTASPEYRHECECRWLLENKPTRPEKHMYLYGVRDRDELFEFDTRTGKTVPKESPKIEWSILKARGMPAADKLLADAKRLHEASKK